MKVNKQTDGLIKLKIYNDRCFICKSYFFQETFPSSNVFVTWFELPIGPLTNTKEIPVDGYIKTLRIAVQPVTSKSDVALFYPNGIKFPHKFE